MEVWVEQCFRDVLKITWDLDHNTPQNESSFLEVNYILYSIVVYSYNTYIHTLYAIIYGIVEQRSVTVISYYHFKV